MDGMELAFDMTPGQENLFDFIDDVAAADALYAANTPAAFGMALRFTGHDRGAARNATAGAHVYR